LSRFVFFHAKFHGSSFFIKNFNTKNEERRERFVAFN
jgi:hypothetical protein